MRKYGAYEVTKDVYKLNEKPLSANDLAGSKVEPNGVVTKGGKAVGVMVEDEAVVGYGTPSRKLELFSKTMADWKWPEFALPEYYRSHIHRSAQAASQGKAEEDFNPQYMPTVEWPKDSNGDVYTLLPIFRLPNLVHTRSGNAKYLYEISHKNPLSLNPVDAKRIGAVATGDLIKVHTEIGFFVLHAWVTEGLAPGVVACSHHLGRWRINKENEVERMSSAWVDLQEVGKGQWKMRQISTVEPYESSDPDTKRVWWSDAGVHQNITFPVHPDPSAGCIAGTRWFAWKRQARRTATEISSSIQIFPSRSIGSGRRSRGLLLDREACGGRCGFRESFGRRKRRSISPRHRHLGHHVDGHTGG